MFMEHAPDWTPRRMPDEPTLARLVLDSVEQFPARAARAERETLGRRGRDCRRSRGLRRRRETARARRYRRAFQERSVEVAAASAGLHAVAVSGREPTDAEANAVAFESFREAAKAMGASAGAARAVAASLAASPANCREVIKAAARAARAAGAVVFRASRAAGLGDAAAAVVQRGLGPGVDVETAVAVARAASGRAAATTTTPPRVPGDVVYLRLPAAAGAQAWRGGLYRRVDPAGDADVCYARARRPSDQVDSFLYRAAAPGRGTLWVVGGAAADGVPRATSAGLATDYDPAARPEEIRAGWRVFDGAGWRPLDGVAVARLAPAAAAAIA